MGLCISSDGFDNRELTNYSKFYFDIGSPRSTAYAVLDFGALVCKSPTPIFTKCPVAKYGICSYYEIYIRDNQAFCEKHDFNK